MADPRAFNLHYHPKVVKEDIPRLDITVRRRIKGAIEKKLAVHPEEFAKPLAYTRARLWCLRVGSWRVIFTIRREQIWVLKIGRRREIYARLDQRHPTES